MSVAADCVTLLGRAPFRPHAITQSFEILFVDIVRSLTEYGQGNRIRIVVIDRKDFE